MMKGQLKFKPGTVALFFFIALVGYVSYTMVAGNLDDLSNSASAERESAMGCSELNIEFVHVNEFDEQVQVFFRSNDNLEGVNVGFEGSNTTKLVEDIRANTLHSTTLNVSDYSNIYIETDRCNNPYWWQ